MFDLYQRGGEPVPQTCNPSKSVTGIIANVSSSERITSFDVINDATIIKRKYQLIERIGNGHFGVVYKARHVKNGSLVAVKMERENVEYKTLKHETKILNYLNQRGSKYVPNIHWYGSWSEHICLIIPYYECTLSDIIVQSKTINIPEIMRSMIYILENIHSFLIIHRDIKPENFMLRGSQLFLIDFGLASFYIDEHGSHIKMDQTHTISGSLKYVSTHVHNGLRSSRRDDLISIGYIGQFMYMRSLPWEIVTLETTIFCELPTSDIRHPVNVMCKRMKENTKWYSETLQRYMTYLYRVEYDAEPNYRGLIELWW
jgi:serine/threonine protein kinase